MSHGDRGLVLPTPVAKNVQLNQTKPLGVDTPLIGSTYLFRGQGLHHGWPQDFDRFRRCADSRLDALRLRVRTDCEQAAEGSLGAVAGRAANVPAAYRLTLFDLAAETSEYTIDNTGAIAVPAMGPYHRQGIDVEGCG